MQNTSTQRSLTSSTFHSFQSRPWPKTFSAVDILSNTDGIVLPREIRVAIAGIGNCASSLVRGTEFYRTAQKKTGLMNEKVGPFNVSDIGFTAAFDIDERKVGTDVSDEIYAEPNNIRTITRLRYL